MPRNRSMEPKIARWIITCLLYTSDAADDLTRVDIGGSRPIKKKNRQRDDKWQEQNGPEEVEERHRLRRQRQRQDECETRRRRRKQCGVDRRVDDRPKDV